MKRLFTIPLTGYHLKKHGRLLQKPNPFLGYLSRGSLKGGNAEIADPCQNQFQIVGWGNDPYRANSALLNGCIFKRTRPNVDFCEIANTTFNFRLDRLCMRT